MSATAVSVESLKEAVASVREQVIEWRHYLHKNPELSFHEVQTSQFVYDTLLSFGNLEVTRPTPTSVIARLIGATPGDTLAMRADMDALPIQEENDFEFASMNPGVMHACGHDGHTAMLLGAAKILSSLKENVRGEIRFLFQHAEEVLPGGAEEMVQAGVMEGVDRVIGIHLISTLTLGKVGIVYGPMMAAPDTFTLTIRGKGGHAAYPHQCIDPIAIGVQVVSNLQQIVARNTDPLDSLVVSVTQFHGGTADNVIPETVQIGGTVRSFDARVRNSAPERMERIIKGVTAAHGAAYDFQYEQGYRPVVNDEEVTRVIEETALELFGEEGVLRLKPTMGGEDFSAYQQKAPGTFFRIGAGNSEKGIVYPHHHARFTIDDDALEYGVTMFVHVAFRLV